MNVRLYDGTVRCADCFDSSTYESETSDPCAYCHSTPDTDTTNTHNAGNPMRPEFKLHTVKISLAKEECSWCYRPALYSIECASWVDLACKAHQEEWFPFKSYQLV